MAVIYKEYLSELAGKISTRDCADGGQIYRKCWKMAANEMAARRDEVKAKFRKERGVDINDRAFDLNDVRIYDLAWACGQYDLCLQKKCRENSRTRKTIVAWGDFATQIYVTKLEQMKSAGKEEEK